MTTYKVKVSNLKSKATFTQGFMLKRIEFVLDIELPEEPADDLDIRLQEEIVKKIESLVEFKVDDFDYEVVEPVDPLIIEWQAEKAALWKKTFLSVYHVAVEGLILVGLCQGLVYSIKANNVGWMIATMLACSYQLVRLFKSEE